MYYNRFILVLHIPIILSCLCTYAGPLKNPFIDLQLLFTCHILYFCVSLAWDNILSSPSIEYIDPLLIFPPTPHELISPSTPRHPSYIHAITKRVMHRRQTAVTAYFYSDQLLLLFAFVWMQKQTTTQ